VNRNRNEKVFFAFIRDVTERKRSEAERIDLYEENMRQYQERIAEEERHQAEKEKILKDLHDGIGGLTTNINLLAELAQKNDDITAVRLSLATIAELSRESLSEIRGFIQSLDARELTWQAVAAELRHLGSTIIESHGMRLSFETSVEGGHGGPGSVVAMNLFRIYKESLANIVKHAKASAVAVAFSVDGANARLDIRDDGIGIVPHQGSGRGMANMQARAEEIRGALVIDAEKGTHVALVVPIP
jgi:signal transduction histidine kinase